MKTATIVVVAVVLLLALSTVGSLPAQAQLLRNPVLEYCTGTWCQWCPCGEDIIANTILPNISSAIIIGYHGPANASNEPFSSFSGNSIISALGFSAYPTGLVDRISASPIDRSVWYSYMSTRWNIWATTQIGLAKTYNDQTRTLSGTVSVTPVSQLTGMFKLNLILLEDSLVYAQTGNSNCPGNSQAVHDHVVRAMINGYLGEDLNTTSPWPSGQIISKTLNYVVPSDYVANHCHLVAIVYKVATPLSTGEIQQGSQWDVPGTVTSVGETPRVPTSFAVSQNYPNPFNPTTNIDYAVSKQSFVSIKVYNLLGQEVRTVASEEKAAGAYTATWNGTDNAGKEVPSGVYLYKMTAGNFSQTNKMMLLR